MFKVRTAGVLYWILQSAILASFGFLIASSFAADPTPQCKFSELCPGKNGGLELFECLERKKNDLDSACLKFFRQGVYLWDGFRKSCRKDYSSFCTGKNFQNDPGCQCFKKVSSFLESDCKKWLERNCWE